MSNKKMSDTLETIKVKRGKLLILAYSKFSPALNVQFEGQQKIPLKSLPGVKASAALLDNIFLSFNFNTSICPNKTFAETEEFIKIHVKDIENRKEGEEYDCLAVCISSHGGDGFFYCHDQIYYLSRLFGYFEIPKLAKIPKLFFIDTCQGDKVDLRENFMSPPGSDDYHYETPLGANYLIAHSSYKGYKALIEQNGGSVFVQELCRVLNLHYRKYDLHDLLTIVGKNVASQKYGTPESHPQKGIVKQMPYFQSSLLTLVRLGRTKHNTKYSELNETIEFFGVSAGQQNFTLVIDRTNISPNIRSVFAHCEGNFIEIECSDLETFRATSIYLQNDRVNINDRNVPGLLDISVKYRINVLQQMCENFMNDSESLIQ